MPLIQEQFFDIGANLTHKSFDKDLEFIITEASELGVKRLSITGSCLEDSKKAYEITKQIS
jgi:TatD DNase family protein